MKKTLIFIGAVFIIMITVFFIRFIIGGPEDTWLCQNGEWIRRGNPKNPPPESGCDMKLEENVEEEKIIVAKPVANQTVESPIEIEGQAKGFWYFEAVFPIELVDENRNQIALGYAQAMGDWMTEDFVDFKASLEYESADEKPAILILKKDNPSGLPEYDEQIEIPVILKLSETMEIKVYFNNSKLDPEYSCNKVFPAKRKVKKTLAPARASLEELLKGVTVEEESRGYITNINENVKIQSLKIENQTAYVDFDPQLEYQVGGSCRVAAVRSQIAETLKQFATVDDVVISINGRTEDILQP